MDFKKRTIAQFLNVKDFPVEIRDKNGKEIYCEYSFGYWVKREYDDNGKEIYYEDSYGRIEDKRKSCSGKIVEIEGKKYKLEEVK